MIGYASTTGNRRNIKALQDAGWHLIVSPGSTGLRTHGMRYALDNGAWSAFNQKVDWDERGFLDALGRVGDAADWVVAPDIVGGGLSSLTRTLQWLPRLDHIKCVLIAVQDGLRTGDVAPYLCRRIGVFVGGSTDYKLRSMPFWGREAAKRNAYMHVGRVNSAVRIRLCAEAGAHSFDGTSASRYATTLPRLDAARLKYAHLAEVKRDVFMHNAR